MDKKTINIMFVICSICLFLAGVLYLCISIFGDTEGSSELITALVCILLGSLFNLIRIQFSKQDK